MDRALWIAKTGLDAQQTRMATISNNLANVSTHGFKKERPIFEDLLYQNVRQVGSQSSQSTQLPSGLHVGTGVRTVAIEKIHSQGNPIQTEKALDVAIAGHGYFQVLTPDGEIGYTRDGAFQLDDTGQIVTASGFLVQPAISVPTDTLSVSISRDGIVSVSQPGSAASTQVGNIDVAMFVNPSGLEPVGGNLYKETASSGAPQVGTPDEEHFGALIQGSLESSNVNAAEELVNMIETQRAFEMNSKAIQATNAMLQFANNTL